MASYKVEQISDIKDFIVIVDTIKHFSEENGNHAELLFRGQRTDKPLLPKLARLNLNGSFENLEKLILKEFKRGVGALSEFSQKMNGIY